MVYLGWATIHCVMMFCLSQRPTTIGEAPLSDDQLATVLLLQFHSLVEGDDGALHLVVGGWLGGDALQP